MQTEIMNEYIFHQVGANMLYSSFQQSNFIFFSSPNFGIRYFHDSGRIYKNNNLLSNRSVKDIFTTTIYLVLWVCIN